MASDRARKGRAGEWAADAAPMRHEAHFGDRVVCCFVRRPQSIFGLFEDAVRRNPEGEALVCGQSRFVWAALDAHVAQLAAALTARGVASGDRVALLLGNGVEFPITLLAVARIGAIAVPLSHRSKAPELHYVINQCGAVAIVHDAVLGSQLPAADDVPTLKLRISVGEWTGSERFDALLQPATVVAGAEVGEEDVAMLMYTSGTTGHPKGAMVTHMNLIHAALTYEYCMNLTMQDRSLIAVPMSHITGIAGLIATVLRCASTLVIMESFRAADFLALAARERVTHTLLVPAMYNLCLLEPDFTQYDLAAWRVGGYGGAPMAPATIASLRTRLPNLSLMNCYGATETVAAVAIMPPEETARHPDRVGRIIPGTAITVMDDSGRELPAGEHGELWVRGPTVVRGYWDDPEASGVSFTGGFWHSGDIGSITADGLVGVHDRKKDMINRGGYKIFTTEVEHVLCTHPAVLEAAVIGKPCPVLGERVHAFVSLKAGPVTADDLEAFCAERLSDYKVPESFTLLEQRLPRNVNGKVLKRELREQVKDLAFTPTTRKDNQHERLH
jgi:acyl-CoA synthetase (AMP-forming)/AMP-acid ligase II